MKSKICTKCKLKKNLNKFYKRKNRKNGNSFRSQCKECCKKQDELYRNNNTKKRKQILKNYELKNKEKIKERKKKYYILNKEKINKRHKDYKEKNRDRYREYYRKYRKYIFYKINKNVSRNINHSLKGNKNSNHWENIVGYTINELIEHLEEISDFTIQDYIEKDLHLDHIIPISVYNFNSFEDEEFKKCWNYRNLRIIPAKENLRKSNNLDMKLIIKYNIQNLLP